MNDILKPGLLLGGLAMMLVFILSLIFSSTEKDIVNAWKSVEKRARKKVYPDVKFSQQVVYILEKKSGKGKGYQIFNEIAKPANFDELKERDSIEFVVLKKDTKTGKADEPFIKDRLGLKRNPTYISLNAKESTKLFDQFKINRVKLLKYNEAYTEETVDGKKINKLKGWVIKYYATGGYAGDIGMLIGYNTDKKITGYKMMDHNETPGLGVKADEKEFVQAFIKKSPADMPITKQDFKPKLGIDSISGATITSLSISIGVKDAFEKLGVGVVPASEIKPIEDGKNGEDKNGNTKPVEDKKKGLTPIFDEMKKINQKAMDVVRKTRPVVQPRPVIEEEHSEKKKENSTYNNLFKNKKEPY